MTSKKKLKYNKFTLPNGIKCYAYKSKEVHSISISVNVKVGTLNESAGNNGIAHMIEHLVFNGTKDFPSHTELDRYVNAISGDGNAFTSIDKTAFYGTFPYQYLEGAIKYYSQLVFSPLLKSKFINNERKIILDELKRDFDQVETHLHNNIIENRFENKKSAYSFDILGSKRNIEKFNRKDVLRFYKKYYRPSNIEIQVSGNFTTSKLKELLIKYFGNKKESKKTIKKLPSVYPKYSGFKIAAKQRLELDQCYLTLNFPSSELFFTKQKERIMVNLITENIASSQFQQSVLWKTLRQDLGLVYGISAWSYSMGYRSFVCIQTSFNPKYLFRVLFEIYNGIENFKQKKISEKVYKAIKRQISDTMQIEMDSPINVINWIAEQEKEYELHKDYLTPEAYIKTINEIGYNDIVKKAQTLFNWDAVNIGVISKYSKKTMENKIAKAWKRITNEDQNKKNSKN